MHSIKNNKFGVAIGFFILVYLFAPTSDISSFLYSKLAQAASTTISFVSDGEGTLANSALQNDLNQIPFQKAAGWNVDIVAWPGDIGYDVTDSGATSSVGWALKAYASSTQGSVPLFFAMGNHEAESAADVVAMRETYARYLNYATTSIHGPSGWNFSRMTSAFSSSTNYAFDIGDVRVIAVNQYSATSSDAVNTTGAIHETTFDWVKAQIKGTSMKHIVIMAHEPMYPVPAQTSGNHIGDALDGNAANRDRWVNLLASYGNINHFVGHTHVSDLYETRDNSPAEGDARTTTTVLDGGIWELDSGAFGTKASRSGGSGNWPSIGYFHANSANWGDYTIRLVQGTGSPDWAVPTVKSRTISDLTRQILVNTWDGSGTGTSTNGLTDMRYYVDYTSAVAANPDWSANNSGKWWEPAFNAATAGWTQGETGVGYKTGGVAPLWINRPIDPLGGLSTTSNQVYSIMQRITFPATSTQSYSTMTLHLDDDDGEMVWLNGTLIYNNTNTPITAPTTGSSSEYFDKSQTDTANNWAGTVSTPTFSTVDVSAYKGSLINGSNTLVVWNVNAGPLSTDLGVAVRLSISGQADVVGPVISSVASTTATPNTANITWTTDEVSDSQVEYGTTISYSASTTLDTATTTSHSVNISGLATSTLYHFRVISKDPSNNRTNSGDFTFTTPAVTASSTGTTTVSLREGVNGYSGMTDTYIDQTASTTNFGANVEVLVDGDTPFANGLLRWDLSSIPASSTITSAAISYYTTNTASPANTYGIYKMRRTWSEADADWNTYDDVNPWATAGALNTTSDYFSTQLGLIGSASLGYATSTLNSSGIAAVQSWVDGSATNYGFLLSDDPTTDGLRFSSSEGVTAAQRPALVLSYTLPAGPDTTAPIVSAIASSTASTTATITWTTDEAATSTVQYGLTTSYGLQATSSGSTSHSAGITGLATSTLYHFRITAIDSLGNTSTTTDRTFTTTSGNDTTAPVISAVASSTTATTATITWTTDEAASSTVSYGTTISYGSSSTSPPLITSHSIVLSGLTAATSYYFKVAGADASGNISSSTGIFTTASASSGWTAYIDAGDSANAAYRSSGNVINFGGADGAGATTTIKYSDGTSTGVTLRIIGDVNKNEASGPEDGIAAENGTTGTRSTPIYPAVGDAATEFGSIVNMANLTSNSAVAGAFTVELGNLDTNKLYTLSLYGARGRYNVRYCRNTLAGATSFTNLSSSGAVVVATTTLPGDTITIMCGGNYSNAGQLAKWSDINPATTTIYATVTGVTFSTSTADKPYLNAIKLVEQPSLDTTAPVISAIASTTASSTANITWTTDEAATSTVQYGLTTSYGLQATSSGSTSHSAGITGLATSTLYHFRITATDTSGNVSTSSDQTFTTTSSIDTTPPIISSIASTTATSTASITWATDEAATSTVQYGLTTSYGLQATSSGSTSHSAGITGLATSTLYHFRVTAIDALGNTSTSTDRTFTTTAPADTTPPVISAVASSTTATTATITWTTDEAASSTVSYGLTTGYGSASSSAALVTSHTILITGLSSGTLYHFKVAGADASGNVSSSTDVTFTTATTTSGWTSYIDVSDLGNALYTSTTTYVQNFGTSDGASTSTIKFADGTATGVTLSYNHVAASEQTGAEDGVPAEDGTAGTRPTPIYPTASTDAMTEFGSKINLGGIVGDNTLGSGFTVNFTNLDTSKLYTIVAYGARGKYSDRFIRYQLLGASSYANQSSAAASSTATTTLTSNDSVIYNGGGNYVNGYVAKWANVDPATTTVQIRIQGVAYNGIIANKPYLTALKLTEQTADVTAPVISSIASTTSTSTASITWSTDETSTSTVQYGLTTSYGSQATSSGSTSHSVGLTGLATSTLYHFRVTAIDTSGNTSTSTDRTFTTTAPADTTAPVISAVASSTGVTTATITWTTDENASSTVNYGTTTSYGTASTSASLVTSHTIELSGLTAATLYHFKVGGADASANVSSSTDYTFTTLAAPDTTAPIISSVASSTGVTTATITWTTNENATSSVNYGLTTGYGSASSTVALVTSHSIVLSGLSGGTSYNFQVSATDLAGNRATSTNYIFTTAVAPDTTAPVISAVSSSTGVTTATITWTTDENASSTVNYGTTTGYGTASTSATLLTSHSISLTGLTAATLYHFKVSGADLAGNVSSSTDYTFTTTAAPDTTPPVISSIASTTSATTALITWTTNENANSGLDFGTTTSYGTASSSGAMETSHTISLSGLTASTLYHFRISSTDASSNLATSTDLTFTTSPDVTAPVISSVAYTSPASSTANITWTTDEASNSVVIHGLTTSYIATTTNASLVTSHVANVTGLRACTEYNYRLFSTDAAANSASTSNSTFITSGCAGSAPVEQTTSIPTVATSTGANATSTSVATTNTLALGIPVGYASSTALFQIKRVDDATAVSGTGGVSGKSVVGEQVYDLQAYTSATTTITNFNADLTISMSYRDADVTSFEESSLGIYSYDGSSWTALSGCSVNTAINVVTCTTNHFTTFGLFGTATTPPSSGGSSGGTISGNGGSGGGYYYVPDVTPTPTPVPTNGLNPSTSARYVFTRTLKLGMIGDDVLVLQRFLNNNGFLIANSGPGSIGKETTKFGLATQYQISQFQLAYKSKVLTPSGQTKPNGELGPATRSFINTGSFKWAPMTYKATVAPTTPVTTPVSSKGAFLKNLKLGDNSADVKRLQKFLNDNGFTIAEEGAGSPGKESTLFGEATKKAVIKFQEAYKTKLLTPFKLTKGTGLVGEATRNLINSLNK